MDQQRANQIIDVWKTVVDVQKHFNELEMRLRGLFITLLLALYASIGFLLEKDLTIGIGGIIISYSTLLPLFGLLATYLFYFIDRHWYHRLLLGSVLHAITIEERHKDVLPELSLGEAIKEQSPYVPFGVMWLVAKLLITDKRFHDTGKIHSDGKIELFYKSVMIFLLLTVVVLACSGGVKIQR